MSFCKWFRGRLPDRVTPPSPPDEIVDEPIDEPTTPEPIPVIGRVLFDPGHTSHTIANRSPKFDDGSVMYEFATVRQIGEFALAGWVAAGFDVVNTAPPVDGPENFPYRSRTANDATIDARAKGLPVWFFSFHTNAVGSTPPVWRPHSRGIEVFYYPRNTRAKAAAAIVARHLHNVTGWPLRYGDGTKAVSFYVLRETIAPANLIEFGFHTNPTEAAALRDPETQKKIASAVVAATVEIFDTIINPLSGLYIADDKII